MFDMVVILGRGIQRLTPDGPWALTEDIEVCDERSAHLPVRVPADDTNQFSMVGGGELNLLAGVELIRGYTPHLAVCAYGHRSDYLESIDAPSESEVMSAQLERLIASQTEVVAWERTRKLSVASNTRQELLNAFDLALERHLQKIAIIAVGVHMPRSATYVAKHLSMYVKYRALSPIVLESEEVLLAFNREEYQERVNALRNSQSFARNWAGKNREADGISKIVRDLYNDAQKPLVVTTN